MAQASSKVSTLACPWPALQRSDSFSKTACVDVHVGRPLHHPAGCDRGCRMHLGVIASSPASKEINGKAISGLSVCPNIKKNVKSFLIFKAAQRRQ